MSLLILSLFFQVAVATDSGLSDWLSAAPTAEESQSEPAVPKTESKSSSLSDWLSAAPTAEEASTKPEAATAKPESASNSASLSDWLSAAPTAEEAQPEPATTKPESAVTLADLETQKKDAISKEDFVAAERIKSEIAAFKDTPQAKLAVLEAQKTEAIAKEDFIAAEKIKGEMATHTIAVLEAQKKEAIAKEDFIAAEKIKAEIATLSSKVETPSPEPAAAPAAAPVATPAAAPVDAPVPNVEAKTTVVTEVKDNVQAPSDTSALDSLMETTYHPKVEAKTPVVAEAPSDTSALDSLMETTYHPKVEAKKPVVAEVAKKVKKEGYFSKLLSKVWKRASSEAPKEVSKEPVTPEAPVPTAKKPTKVAMHDMPHYRNHGGAMHHVEPAPRKSKSMTPEQEARARDRAWKKFEEERTSKKKLAERRDEVESAFHVHKSKAAEGEVPIATGASGGIVRYFFFLAALVSLGGLAYQKYEVIREVYEGKQGPPQFKAKQEDMYAPAPGFARQMASNVQASVVGSVRPGLARRGATSTMDSFEFGV